MKKSLGAQGFGSNVFMEYIFIYLSIYFVCFLDYEPTKRVNGECSLVKKKKHTSKNV